jgi:division protein CdvB (Snf7/Vps24/ESCRT-III family)
MFAPTRTEWNMALNLIISANVTLFAGQFVGESDFARRGQLKKLLIEEENKFGLLTEKLEQVLRRLGESSARIASLETILERSRSNGRETGPTEQLLRNMRELHRVYDDYRQTIVDGLNRTPL